MPETPSQDEGRWRFLAPPPGGAVEPAAAPPTFSVIVAAYNVADVIGDALASLARQTVAPLEVIVCDDGSTDDLEGALAPFAEEIVFLRQAQGGEAAAKNAAAGAARGDFLLVLDADDMFFPERVQALGELAKARPDLDVLTTDAYLVVGDRRVRRNYDRRWTFEVADQRRAILQRNFVFGLAAVRRQRFLEHQGFDESIRWTTDWDLWLRLILDGSGVGAVDAPLALYRIRESSLTARRRELTHGKIATLEKANRNGALTAADRSVVEEALLAYRAELAVHELDASILGHDPAVRRQALAVARSPRVSVARRLSALAVAAAPRLTGRVVRRRAQSSWVGAGGTRVFRDGRVPLRTRISKWAGARDVG
ncbi:MAG TPA: glycosyltransferase family A protein [Gaiellaceae bacterium]|nr:glycosyltransferase family A protein [Gaiellaceae bacterium]